MIKVKITLDKEWQRLAASLDPVRFHRSLEVEVDRATRRNCRLAQEHMVNGIATGDFTRSNAGLTVAMKGSSLPLVDVGELKENIEIVNESWDRGYVGVISKTIKDRRFFSRRKTTILEVARIVHNGAVVTVTQEMRNFFSWLHSIRPEIKPLKVSTKTIVIPKRPFLQTAFKKPMIEEYMKNYGEAVRRAILWAMRF
jgi:hypothetical protein